MTFLTGLRPEVDAGPALGPRRMRWRTPGRAAAARPVPVTRATGTGRRDRGTSRISFGFAWVSRCVSDVSQ
jgi:hypothetical protein